MNKRALIFWGVAVVCMLILMYLTTPAPSKHIVPNKAFAAFAGSIGGVGENILLGVEMSVDPPENNAETHLEQYVHAADGVYIRLIPRYAASVIRIERMEINLQNSRFEPNNLLMKTESTENYALLLHASLPEGGPQLRVTVTLGEQSAVYEPTYDGSDETSYPVVRNGYILKNTIR